MQYVSRLIGLNAVRHTFADRADLPEKPVLVGDADMDGDRDSDQEEAEAMMAGGVPGSAAATSALGGNYDEDDESWVEIMQKMSIKPSEYDSANAFMFLLTLPAGRQ